MQFVRRSSLLAPLVLVLGVATIGCTSSSADAIAVEGTDTECTPATDTAAAGDITFEFTNNAGEVSELYVLRADGSVASEVENVTPGTTRKLTVSLSAGTYTLNCKPGQAGDGISTPFTVTGEGGDTVPASGTPVEVEAKDYSFTLEGSPTFTSGKSYTFTLVNEGTMDHEMEVFGPDGTALGEVPPTKAGERGSVTIAFDEPGTYRLVCGIAGHEAKGMSLDLEVG
jgi:iron uptake system component EfeO